MVEVLSAWYGFDRGKLAFYLRPKFTANWQSWKNNRTFQAILNAFQDFLFFAQWDLVIIKFLLLSFDFSSAVLDSEESGFPCSPVLLGLLYVKAQKNKRIATSFNDFLCFLALPSACFLRSCNVISCLSLAARSFTARAAAACTSYNLLLKRGFLKTGPEPTA